VGRAKSTPRRVTVWNPKKPWDEGRSTQEGAENVNVVYWLRRLGERRRDLAWRLARRRVVTDAVDGSSLSHGLPREQRWRQAPEETWPIAIGNDPGKTSSHGSSGQRVHERFRPSDV
jgi:hypothetical protein